LFIAGPVDVWLIWPFLELKMSFKTTVLLMTWQKKRTESSPQNHQPYRDCHVQARWDQPDLLSGPPATVTWVYCCNFG